MISVDLHSHSNFSRCGIHSVVEMLSRARELGLKGLAITDHGPELKSGLNSPFFERLVDPVPGIRLLKGIEANLRGDAGAIDVPSGWIKWTDIVLLGIHVNTPAGLGADAYTHMLVAAIDRNPCVDIITHPDDPTYTIDFTAVAQAAARSGVALELNNSKVSLGRTTTDLTMRMLEACRIARCRVAVCSDAHALNEIGCDEAVRPLLERAGFPAELVVNDTAQRAFAFVEERRPRKKS